MICLGTDGGDSDVGDVGICVKKEKVLFVCLFVYH